MFRIYLPAVEESNFLHSCEVKFARGETLYKYRENLTKNEGIGPRSISLHISLARRTDGQFS